MRAIALVTLAAILAGCSFKGVPDPVLSKRDAEYMASISDAGPDPNFGRYIVEDPTGEKPGTVVVETKKRLLYLVLPNKKAVRYGVAVGNEAFGWTGKARVARKAEWPSWTPPAEMKARWPHVRPVEGGPASPLGARALYLYEGSRDTLYRIHGTNEPETIGQAVSSGCIRLRNIDAVDLYSRVPVGATVIIR
jgi:lipoprotein-anchoring transpeptidase ErfK/SrfK